MFTLQGKEILVTGASSGIGRTAACMAAARGARMTLLARNEERLRQTMESLDGDGHRTMVCDLTDEDSLKEAVAQMPPLDGLVLCAGINEFMPVKFIRQDKLERVFQTNCFAHLLLVQLLLKRKKVNPGASIVFVSSVSSLMGVPGTLMYAASKGAVNSAVRVLASELAPQGIRVNAVCPGIVRSEMLAGTNITEEAFTGQERQYPLGLGRPEDVGFAALFHLCDGSRWLTGQTMVLDGGMTLI